METTLVRSPIETKKYRPACHPHQNRWSFPKKPASGGRPPRDKRHRAKERAKKGYFVYNPATYLRMIVIKVKFKRSCCMNINYIIHKKYLAKCSRNFKRYWRIIFETI